MFVLNINVAVVWVGDWSVAAVRLTRIRCLAIMYAPPAGLEPATL